MDFCYFSWGGKERFVFLCAYAAKNDVPVCTQYYISGCDSSQSTVLYSATMYVLTIRIDERVG